MMFQKKAFRRIVKVLAGPNTLIHLLLPVSQRCHACQRQCHEHVNVFIPCSQCDKIAYTQFFIFFSTYVEKKKIEMNRLLSP